MSADQQSVDRPSSSTTPIQHSSSGLELEFRAPSRSTDSADADSGVEPTAPALPHRIERFSLQARIAALERELEASEDRNQTLITQYERILDDRAAEPTRTDSSSRTGSLLERLIDRFR